MESTVEVKFAKRLASNNKKERDGSLKKLKKYIAVRSAKTDFSRDELMKLLKGLHYAIWMQDKPLLQEELSNKIVGLMDVFSSPQAALKFAACFFATEAREWKCLDQWRMDKFMMLVRDLLRQTFKVAQHAGWEMSASTVAEMIKEEVMRPDKEEIADSLRLHLADIYLDELKTVGAEQLTGHQIGILLGPFYHFIQASRRLHITDQVIHQTFGCILRQARLESKARRKSQETKSAQKKNMVKRQFQLNYSYSDIASTLFDLAQASPCPSKVRRKIYNLVKMFCNALGSCDPLTLGNSASTTDVSMLNDSNSSATMNSDTSTNKPESTTGQASAVPVQQCMTNEAELTELSLQAQNGIHRQSGPSEQRQLDREAVGLKRKHPDPVRYTSSAVQQPSSEADEKSVGKKRRQRNPVQQQSFPVQQQSSQTNTKTVSRKRKRCSGSGDELQESTASPSTPLHQAVMVKMGSEKKQVVFDLDKNSSQELQDFIQNGSMTLSTPLPALSPRPGILKASPFAPAPKRRKLTSAGTSPSPGAGRMSLSVEDRAKSVMRQINRAQKLSRFEAKKQKQKIKKPRRR